jgi:WD domain, G-beta repeat
MEEQGLHPVDHPTLRKASVGLAFSPDGKRLATRGIEGIAEIWDTGTCRRVQIFKGHSGSILAIAFSPDGTRLATGGVDGTLRLWDATARQDSVSVPKDGVFAGEEPQLSPDGQTLLTDHESGVRRRLRLWDTAAAAGCAMVFTVFMYFRSQLPMRRSTCFELYKLWSASMFTDLRHRAWNKLEQMSKDTYLMKEYSEDNEFIRDFSQIEHFFVYLHRLVREKIICPKLARTLFANSTHRWLDRLESTIDADQCRYSFHCGRTAEEARQEFVTEILSLRGILKIEKDGNRRSKPMSVPAD